MVGLFNGVVLDFGPDVIGYKIRHTCYGPLEVDYIESISSGDVFGIYLLGWELGVRRKLRPVLELVDSRGKLHSIPIPTKSFADFCRDFDGGCFEGCVRVCILK